MTMREPLPEDYPDRMNDFIKDRIKWERMQPLPLPSIPEDLRYLFTEGSLKEADRRDRETKE